MTEREKMLAGSLYDPGNEELVRLRKRAHRLCAVYNGTFEEEEERRKKILHGLLPDTGEDVYLQGPVYFDYGVNTHIGSRFYANFNLTVLDCCPVRIGDDVQLGPNVSLVTPVHPMRWQERNTRPGPDGRLTALEYARPIVIGSNCWLAAGVTVVGGCRIGDGCVIGAGSVVTKDIPPNVFAAGVPCRVLRPITEADALNL